MRTKASAEGTVAPSTPSCSSREGAPPSRARGGHPEPHSTRPQKEENSQHRPSGPWIATTPRQNTGSNGEQQRDTQREAVHTPKDAVR